MRQYTSTTDSAGTSLIQQNLASKSLKVQRNVNSESMTLTISRRQNSAAY